MTRGQKQEYAKILFLKESLKQKEIAERVGVTEKTIGNWLKKGDWQRLKTSLVITKEAELRRIYIQINELNTHIEDKEDGNKFANNKEADTLSKLAATAKALETDASLSEVMEVFRGFLNYMRGINLEKTQDIVMLQDAYIKTLLK